MSFSFSSVLKKHSVVAIAGNRNAGKTSLALYSLVELKKEHPLLPVYVLGVEDNLEDYLLSRGIVVLRSSMDLLDLRIKDSVVYVSEFATFFDSRNKNKALDKLMRFFDRVEHQNCKFIIDTAREGFYNKFFCSRVGAFLVKEIEYDSLVNGSWLKERVKAITSVSDYRLVCSKSNYYLVSNDGGTTERHQFPYVKELDSKKDNKDLFSHGSLAKVLRRL